MLQFALLEIGSIRDGQPQYLNLNKVPWKVSRVVPTKQHRAPTEACRISSNSACSLNISGVNSSTSPASLTSRVGLCSELIELDWNVCSKDGSRYVGKRVVDFDQDLGANDHAACILLLSKECRTFKLELLFRLFKAIGSSRTRSSLTSLVDLVHRHCTKTIRRHVGPTFDAGMLHCLQRLGNKHMSYEYGSCLAGDHAQ